MNREKSGTARHGRTVLHGVLMGGADIVPGVSGGTVALILGIYERLVTAISHFDLRLLRLLGKRRWGSAALYVDLPFLVPLGAGILLGFVIMTTLMHHLLSTEKTRSLTLAMFFGLILASGVLVALMIKNESRSQLIRSLLLGASGAAFALWLTGLVSANITDPHLAYIFITGAVAICAMILPGISGAMILLILGVYIHLTGIPEDILRGQDVAASLLTVVVFASGCAIGLVSFSKLLRWLLARHHAGTMAVLCGFMFGSLRKLWPFQADMTPQIQEVKLKTFRLYWPTEFDGHFFAVVMVIALAVIAVLSIDWFTHGHLRRQKKPLR